MLSYYSNGKNSAFIYLVRIGTMEDNKALNINPNDGFIAMVILIIALCLAFVLGIYFWSKSKTQSNDGYNKYFFRVLIYLLVI